MDGLFSWVAGKKEGEKTTTSSSSFSSFSAGLTNQVIELELDEVGWIYRLVLHPRKDFGTARGIFNF